MIKELLYKWFGLESPPCLTCEVLRSQLDESNIERRELLKRLLERDKPEPVMPVTKEDFHPIRPQHTPWRVRQQMLEAEDRKAAQLLKQKNQEIKESKIFEGKDMASISELEKELNIPDEETVNG